MWKKMRRRKSFWLWYFVCELYPANITCPEGQIFNNHTSSCEAKKVDTTTENDDPHELVYSIKSKETKRTLRKLDDEK